MEVCSIELSELNQSNTLGKSANLKVELSSNRVQTGFNGLNLDFM